MCGSAETPGAWSDLEGEWGDAPSCATAASAVTTLAAVAHNRSRSINVIVITCAGLRKRRARGRICEHVLEPLLRVQEAAALLEQELEQRRGHAALMSIRKHEYPCIY